MPSPTQSHNIDFLVRQLFALNATKGWHKDDITSAAMLAAKISLVTDELHEAAAAENKLEFNGSKPDGQIIEYVDVCWRAWELIHWLGFTPSELMSQRSEEFTIEVMAKGAEFSIVCEPKPTDPVVRWVSYLRMANRCVRMVRRKEPRREVALVLMLLSFGCMGEIGILCHEVGIDPMEAFQRKYDYNVTRPQRHGGMAF